MVEKMSSMIFWVVAPCGLTGTLEMTWHDIPEDHYLQDWSTMLSLEMTWHRNHKDNYQDSSLKVQEVFSSETVITIGIQFKTVHTVPWYLPRALLLRRNTPWLFPLFSTTK
jgi:hypothetical protein